MSSCAGLSIHAPAAPPHFQGSVGGGGASCAQRPTKDVIQESIATGISNFSHPLREVTGYHPNYFLLGFRAAPSIPTSRCSASWRGIEGSGEFVLGWGRAREGKGQAQANRQATGLAGGRAVPCDVWEEPGKGSLRPVSIGSSHCLTQYGCKG